MLGPRERHVHEPPLFVEHAWDVAVIDGIEALFCDHTKAELYAIALEGHSSLLAALRETDDPQENFTERLCAVVAAFASWHAENHKQARVVQYELHGLTPTHFRKIAPLRHQVTDVIAGIVAGGVTAGEFQVDNVDDVVMVNGEVEFRGGSVKIIGRDVLPMWKVREQLVKSIVSMCEHMGAAVVARPDEKWGETPVAFVELKPGARATPDELIAFCRDNLARYKCPRHVVFRELPKTSTGKIQKFELRKAAAEV